MSVLSGDAFSFAHICGHMDRRVLRRLHDLKCRTSPSGTNDVIILNMCVARKSLFLRDKDNFFVSAKAPCCAERNAFDRICKHE